MRRIQNLSWTVAYIVAIALVNWGFRAIPLIGGWPPMSLAVGCIFVMRDYAQREIGSRWIFAAMLAGGALSWALADPFVALASVAAFALSELLDWGIYTYSGRPFSQRVILSSLASAPIDSAAFLLLIGVWSPLGIAMMTASKMAGAAALCFWLNRRAQVRY